MQNTNISTDTSNNPAPTVSNTLDDRSAFKKDSVASASSPDKKSSSPVSLIVIGLLLIAVVIGMVYLFIQGSGVTVSEVDQALTEVDAELTATEDIEKGLEDLPEDFLNEPMVETTVIDDSAGEIDEQLKDLEDLEDDFEFSDLEVGL